MMDTVGSAGAGVPIAGMAGADRARSRIRVAGRSISVSALWVTRPDGRCARVRGKVDRARHGLGADLASTSLAVVTARWESTRPPRSHGQIDGGSDNNLAIFPEPSLQWLAARCLSRTTTGDSRA